MIIHHCIVTFPKFDSLASLTSRKIAQVHANNEISLAILTNKTETELETK